MPREHKYLASLFLSAALMAPVGALARPSPQWRHKQEKRERREEHEEHEHEHN
jgi:hypothetical protein